MPGDSVGRTGFAGPDLIPCIVFRRFPDVREPGGHAPETAVIRTPGIAAGMIVILAQNRTRGRDPFAGPGIPGTEIGKMHVPVFGGGFHQIVFQEGDGTVHIRVPDAQVIFNELAPGHGGKVTQPHGLTATRPHD